MIVQIGVSAKPGIGERGKFNIAMLGIVCSMIVINLVFAYIFQYGGEVRNILYAPLAVGFVFACSTPALLICWEWRRKWFSMSLDLGLISAWSTAVWILGAQMVQVAARAPFPLVDEKLAKLDGHLIQTAAIVHWVEQSPSAQKLSLTAYRLLPILAIVALAGPILIGRPHVSRRYVLSVSLSIVLMLVIFAFLPAAGPWTVEHFVGTKAQASVDRYLMAVKSGATAGLEQQSDIVAFPSFHVILAVLAAVSLCSVAGVRYFAIALAGCVCVSTATTGWHYLVDIIAGLVVAGTSHFLAVVILRQGNNADEFDSSHLTTPRVVM